MVRVRLRHAGTGEVVGWIDCTESTARYWGDDGAVGMLLEEVDAGILETRPAEVGEDWEGLRPSKTVQLTGEALLEHVEGVLGELDVECERVEDGDDGEWPPEE